MAILQPTQILKLLKTPQHAKPLKRCIQQEQRLEMHAKALINKDDFGPAHRNFLSWVESILPKDKYQKFEKLMPCPLPTVEITETIFTALRRVFEAQDAYIKYEFTSPELEADFNDYREQLGDTQFWQTDGFEALQTALHSVVICDLPAVQNTQYPEPYYYLLDVSKVVDMQVNKNGGCEYIIFQLADDEEGNKYRAVFDDAAYRIYKCLRYKSEYNLDREPVEHSLGYCPAKPFWSEFLNRQHDFIQKKGPITNVLGLLDDFLFWEVSFKYFQMYGAFPILWEYPSECEYQDAKGNKCQGGYVNTEVPDGEGYRECKEECPRCKVHALTGPGSIISKPMPDTTNPDIGDPVGIVAIGVDTLDWQLKVQQQRKEAIKSSAIGRDVENREAQNVEQVYGTFESKQDIINGIKRGFEEIHKWTLDTIARLRYATNFTASNLSYGTQFYLSSAEEYQEEYAASKTAGMPMYVLATTRMSVDAAKYRNNPDMLERSQIMANLEPYPDLTIEQIVTLKGQGLINEEDLLVKLQFDSLIKRFEREQLPVQQVGTINTDYDKRITLIKDKIYSYVRENKLPAVAAAANGGNSQNGSGQQGQQVPAAGGGERLPAFAGNASGA